MKLKPNQSTLFDWMLLVVVAAFASKAAKSIWQVWQSWPDFIGPWTPQNDELRNQVVINCLCWAVAAVVAALIMFFRNRWHRRKEKRWNS